MSKAERVKIQFQHDQHWTSRNDNVNDLLYINAYDDSNKIFVGDDYSIGSVFLCNSDFSDLNVSIDKLSAALERVRFHNSYLLQVILYKSKIYGKYIDDSFADNNNQNLKSYNDFETFEKMDATSDRLLICVKTINSSPIPDDIELETFKSLRDSIFQKMESLELDPVIIDDKTYTNILLSIFGSDAVGINHNNYDEEIEISSQIIPKQTCIEVSGQFLKFGDQFAQVLSLKRTPKTIYYGDAIRFCGDIYTNLNHNSKRLICTNILYEKSSELEPMPLSVMDEAYISYDEPSTSSIDDEECDEFKPLVSTTVCVFADTEQNLSTYTNHFITRLNSCDIRFQIDSFIQMPLLFNSLPLNTDLAAIDDAMRYRTYSLNSLAISLNIMTEFLNRSERGPLLQTRNGQIDRFDASETGALIITDGGKGFDLLVSSLVSDFSLHAERTIAFGLSSSQDIAGHTVSIKHINNGNPNLGFLLNPLQSIDDSNDIDIDDVAQQILDLIYQEQVTESKTNILKVALKRIMETHSHKADFQFLTNALAASNNRALIEMSSKLSSLNILNKGLDHFDIDELFDHRIINLDVLNPQPNPLVDAFNTIQSSRLIRQLVVKNSVDEKRIYNVVFIIPGHITITSCLLRSLVALQDVCVKTNVNLIIASNAEQFIHIKSIFNDGCTPPAIVLASLNSKSISYLKSKSILSDNTIYQLRTIDPQLTGHLPNEIVISKNDHSGVFAVM